MKKAFFHIIMAGFIVLLICPVELLAGAWGQKQGAVFMSLQGYFYTTDQYYDRSGDIHDRGGDFTKFEINSYVEYGLTDNDIIVLNIFYDWLSDDASGKTRKTEGFADLELGWQHCFYQGPVGVFSVQGLGIIPTGYDIEDDPRLGYDRFGAELAMLYGRSFKLYERYGFADFRFGVREYFGYPATQLRTMLTTGYYIAQRWQLMGSAELHYGLDNGSDKELGPNLLIEPNYRLLKLTLSLRYRLSEHYSLVGAGYHHTWGEDTGRGGGAYVSLWCEY